MTTATAKNPTGYRIIDVDAHISEPHDLWTKRAPAKRATTTKRATTKAAPKA